MAPNPTKNELAEMDPVQEDESKPLDPDPEEDTGMIIQDNKHVSFDDILREVGEFGRYQKKIYFLLFLPTIFSAMHKLAWVFLGAKADHRCKLPGEPVNASYFIEACDEDYYPCKNVTELLPWDSKNNR